MVTIRGEGHSGQLGDCQGYPSGPLVSNTTFEGLVEKCVK